MLDRRTVLLLVGASATALGLMLLVVGFVAFSVGVAVAGARDESGDGTIELVAWLLGAVLTVAGAIVVLAQLIRR